MRGGHPVKPKRIGICRGCELPMEDGTGCTVRAYSIADQEYARVPFSGFLPCHDCGVTRDQLHHLSCDVEECPRCQRQALSCGCREVR